jgi:hypothetical protein
MKRISASKAKWKLRKYLKSKLFWTRRILLFDNYYDLVDESKLNLTPVQLGHGSDCDEKSWVMLSHTMKAYIMMGEVIEKSPNLLFGFLEGYDRRNLKHAWCFYLRAGDQQVKYVEPSTAEIYLPSNERVYHFIR